MNDILAVIIIITLSLASFWYGLWVGNYKIFPFNILEKIRAKLFTKQNKQQRERPYIYETKVTKLIRVNNEHDITKKRTELCEYLWPSQGFPYAKMPTKIENNISDSRYSDLKNLKRIDKLTIEMEYGVNSISYLFVAEQSNNKLIVYVAGHGGDFISEKYVIKYFLERGFSVIAFSMPLLGMNSQPIVDFPEFGKIKLEFHNQLILLETERFHPLKYYFEPVTLSLNYLDQNFKFDSYYMIGLSGGGWTTVVYPALDTRISQGYSVAGANPIFLRLDNTDFFDYEHTAPQFYRIANYEELYVMASHKHRTLVQIYNKYDTCCFANDLYNVYQDDVKKKIFELGGGTFENYLDDTYKGHKISDYALGIISKHMGISKLMIASE